MIERLKRIKNYPVGMCGTALGFMVISNCIGSLGFDYLKPISVVFAIIALYFMAIKVIFYPRQVLEELKHPVMGSFYPTIDMVAFLLASVFFKADSKIAIGILFAATLIHLCLFLIFFGYRLREFKIENLYPSWFIVLVGMVTGTATAKAMGYPTLAAVLFWIGLVLYIISWPFVLYRVFKKKNINDKVKASVIIMAAPASLCIVGYLALDSGINGYLLTVLVITSIFNLIFAYVNIPALILSGFKPNYGALTFPLAISVLAALKLSVYLYGIGYMKLAVITKGIGVFETIICAIIILYVIINYIILFLKALFSKVEIAN